MNGKRLKVLVIGGLAALLAANLISTAVGGPSLKRLVHREVHKQLAHKTGPRGPAGFSGLTVVEVTSAATDSSSPKFAVAPCPAGKVAVGGGVSIPSVGGDADPLAVRISSPGGGTPPAASTQWIGGAVETDPLATNWAVVTRVICANAN